MSHSGGHVRSCWDLSGDGGRIDVYSHARSGHQHADSQRLERRCLAALLRTSTHRQRRSREVGSREAHPEAHVTAEFQLKRAGRCPQLAHAQQQRQQDAISARATRAGVLQYIFLSKSVVEAGELDHCTLG